MIPKHMTFFWANEEMSWMRFMTLYSFRKLNPDWKMTLFLSRPNEITTKVWADTPIQDFHNFSGRDYFRSLLDLDIHICNWEFENRGRVTSDTVGASHKSNFFKWQWMAKEGGFYSDLDILYVRPFDDFYQKCKDFDTVICHHGYFSIGLLGSSGNNNLFKNVYDYTFKNYGSSAYQSAGVLSIYSLCGRFVEDNNFSNNYTKWPRGLAILVRHYKKMSFYNIPIEVVYPWLFDQMEHVFEEEYTSIPDECIGIHWYAGSELGQKYNNLLNEENYKEYSSTFTYFAREVKTK